MPIMNNYMSLEAHLASLLANSGKKMLKCSKTAENSIKNSAFKFLVFITLRSCEARRKAFTVTRLKAHNICLKINQNL